MKNDKTRTNKTPKNSVNDIQAAIQKASQSPYCQLAADDEISYSPQLYLVMTASEEILGLTENPTECNQNHCVRASDTDVDFIGVFQNNWPKLTPSFWELEIYRKYREAKLELYCIGRSTQPAENILHRMQKVQNLMTT